MARANQQHSKGFTLIEILVTVSVFALIAVAIASIYLAFSTIQARFRASQVLLNDTQYVLEIMAREIKNSAIVDYDLSDGTVCEAALGLNYTTCIFLEKENGQTVAFARSETDEDLLYIVCEDGIGDCDEWNVQGNERYYTRLLLPGINNIEAQELQFVITPSTDPFGDSGINEQPMVTIRLKSGFVREVGGVVSDRERVTHVLQTTVSSRVYKR